MEASIAQSLVGTTHTIKNCTMNVGVARPKSEIERMKAAGYSSGGSYRAGAAYTPSATTAATAAATAAAAYDPYSAAAAAAYAQNPYAAYAYGTLGRLNS